MTRKPTRQTKPPLLPEQGSAHKTQPTPTVRSRRGYVISLLLALILLSIAFFSTAVIVLNKPGLVGLEARADIELTAASFEGTREALESTADALGATAQFNAGQVFSIDSTRAALDNRQTMLEQAETQSVLDTQATQTAIAIANAQQATRAALDFQATQAAFDVAATQVELAYQGTQAALNQEATAAALGFATDAPSGQDILTQTPPPTITAQPLFTDGFEGGLSGSLWEFSAVQDWSLGEDGLLVADRSGAWLLTQLEDLDGYIFEADLLPLQGAALAADYHLLLNVQAAPQAPNGIALRLSYNGQRVTAAGLHFFALEDLFTNDGLLNRALTTIESNQVNLSPDDEIRVRVELREARIVVIVNAELALDVTLDSVPLPGSVGLQVPQGAGIVRVALLP